MTSDSLQWSAQLRLTTSPPSKRLQGDKINLPQSALEGLLAAAPVVSLQDRPYRNLTGRFDPFDPHSFAAEREAREILADRQQQLPQPLTFRLVNPQNGRAVYAGIREFSAEEGEIELSPLLQDALGLSSSAQSTRESSPLKDTTPVDPSKTPQVTVRVKTLAKGTYVRLRPLEAGYDPEDWKSLLERYLRDNFTTLTMNELLTISGVRHEKFRFLIDKFEPEEEAICIVDTDLEVDIEALNEEQARETLSKRLEKSRRAPGTNEGSSVGGVLVLGQPVHGQVLAGEYVDYQLQQWDRTRDLEVKIETEDNANIDLFVSPFSSRLRSKPRSDEYVFAGLDDRPVKKLKLMHTNVDLEEAEHLSIAVGAWRDPAADLGSKQPATFSITVQQSQQGQSIDEGMNGGHKTALQPDEVLCKNCQQPVPKRTLVLHEAFCYRNNTSCPKCQGVFLKNSVAWKQHWHCPHDNSHGDSTTSRSKHDSIFHPTTTTQCPSCDFEAYNLPVLAQHRTTTCPGKEILCQFCHLLVPQQGSDDPSFTDPEVLMSGMTPHEYSDGARTTECHICSRIVRLRDMKIHLKIHDRERVGRVTPKLCSNRICGRTIGTADERRVHQEQLGLCDVCFGPLYITTHDPDGRALRRRIERRLLSQMVGGCGKSYCNNVEWCKTGRKNSTGQDRTLTTKDALPMIKPVLEKLANGSIEEAGLAFCVAEDVQSRRAMGEMMAAEEIYDLAWCIRALQESHNDINQATNWLGDRAPKIFETV